MGLAVKTQYHINGQGSHRYWKLVTLPLQSHLFYCSQVHCTFTGVTVFGSILAFKPLHVLDGHNGQSAKLMYIFNSSGNKTAKTIYYVVICGLPNCYVQ